MASPLVIVESPAKARTIARFLGDGYVVESSIGHIRDLPSNAAAVPASHKKESWARLGVDVDNHFKPLYVVSADKKDHVRHLKDALKGASELYLATDEDREGEAIAWHLLEVLNPSVPVKRMVFHEITPAAIHHAIENPRDLDRRLVDAQEARRIFDRLYGYEVSPVLWKKVMPRLSAGRVQSVATRIVVERERERMAFRSASYWDLGATFALSAADKDHTPFTANLLDLDGQRVATGKDFGPQGELTGSNVLLLDEAAATSLRDGLQGRPAEIRSVERKPYTRKPSAPFMTSTLQQEAGRKLRYSSSQTMSVAQRLYENGFITYMRTDSTTLSDTAISAARAQILEKYGEAYLPATPRLYTKKVKNAQEAHEAIRPAGDRFRTPEQVRSELPNDQFRLYEMIWQRTVASQMNDARGESMAVRIDVTATDQRTATFAASGKTVLFPGYLRAYVEGADDPDAELDDSERILPDMVPGDAADLVELTDRSHETLAPARYTEASLVRRLEELGVGRPSTYAATINTILDRGYVWKKATALVPSFTAFAVVTLLEMHFPDLVDYALTARMEDDLDHIANGSQDAEPWLSKFYFGNGESAEAHEAQPGLKAMVSDLDDIDPRAVNSIPIGLDEQGRLIVARVGRYGPYLQRGEGEEAERASVPDNLPPDELTLERCIELLEAPSGDREVGLDPNSGEMIYAKAGRYGPYVQVGELVKDSAIKPPTASLFKSMDPTTVTLEDALKVLSLPRVVGVDPADAQEITAQNGRYGPYIKKGNDSRTIDSEERLLTITVEECQRIFAEPKRGRGGVTKPPLKDLGPDPDSGKPVLVKDGRFGPYVTDGETNASLRRSDVVEELTMERAQELLADRRAKGPSTKKKASARKAPAKKGPVKKAATKKAPAKKKAAAKKAPAKSASKKVASPQDLAAEAARAVADEPF